MAWHFAAFAAFCLKAQLTAIGAMQCLLSVKPGIFLRLVLNPPGQTYYIFSVPDLRRRQVEALGLIAIKAMRFPFPGGYLVSVLQRGWRVETM